MLLVIYFGTLFFILKKAYLSVCNCFQLCKGKTDFPKVKTQENNTCHQLHAHKQQELARPDRVSIHLMAEFGLWAGKLWTNYWESGFTMCKHSCPNGFCRSQGGQGHLVGRYGWSGDSRPWQPPYNRWGHVKLLFKGGWIRTSSTCACGWSIICHTLVCGRCCLS